MEIGIVLIIAFSFWLQASVGFGGGLLSIPLLALLINPSDAISLVLLFQLMMGTLIFFNRSTIDWSGLKPVLILMVLGAIAGTFIHVIFSKEIIYFVLAFIIFIYAFKNMFLPHLKQKIANKDSRWLKGLLPLTGGIVLGGFGMGGPLFVMYYNEYIKNKVIFRSTLITTLFLCNIVRVIVSTSYGLISADVLLMGSYSFPPFVCAVILGQKYHVKIKDEWFRMIVNLLLFISSIALFIKAFSF